MTAAVPYEAQVRGYLADCWRHRTLLDPAYHPAAAGAVKMIPHYGSTVEAGRIRETFQWLTSQRAAA